MTSEEMSWSYGFNAVCNKRGVDSKTLTKAASGISKEAWAAEAATAYAILKGVFPWLAAGGVGTYGYNKYKNKASTEWIPRIPLDPDTKKMVYPAALLTGLGALTGAIQRPKSENEDPEEIKKDTMLRKALIGGGLGLGAGVGIGALGRLLNKNEEVI